MKNTEFELIAKADEMKTIPVNGRVHVVRSTEYRYGRYPEPNYQSTGMALVAVLKKGQTLDDFKKQWVEMKLKQNDY